MAFEFIVYSVNVCCFLGILVNFLLIYVAKNYSQKMGAFKNLLIVFCCMEILFALVVLMTQPMFYAFHHRLILMSHNTYIGPTASHLISGVYCAFYELWLGLVVILFTYKYIALCRERVMNKIRYNIWPKVLILAIYIAHVTYSFVCGIIWCSKNKLPEDMRTRIKGVFQHGLQEDQFYGYIVVTFINEQEQFNIPGFFSVVDHFVLITISFSIIIFCGNKIYKKITEMQNSQHSDYRRNIQIFYTLVLQAAVPFVMYQIPTALFIGDALIEDEPTLINFIPLWSLLMSLPKVIDPLIIMFIIKEYRVAIKGVFCKRKVGPHSATSSSGPHANSNSITTN